jgi:hypothetical protein
MRNDYEDNFIGNRTSKHSEYDMMYALCKRDIDNCFFSMVEQIGGTTSVSLSDEYCETDGIEVTDPVDSAFRLGYLQAKKDILEVIDKYEIHLLEIADKELKERNK